MHFADYDDFSSVPRGMEDLAVALQVFEVEEEHLLDPALLRTVTAG